MLIGLSCYCWRSACEAAHSWRRHCIGHVDVVPPRNPSSTRTSFLMVVHAYHAERDGASLQSKERGTDMIKSLDNSYKRPSIVRTMSSSSIRVPTARHILQRMQLSAIGQHTGFISGTSAVQDRS